MGMLSWTDAHKTMHFVYDKADEKKRCSDNRLCFLMGVTWTQRTRFLLQIAQRCPSREGRVRRPDLLQKSGHIWRWQSSSITARPVCWVTTVFCILMNCHLLLTFNLRGEVLFLLSDPSICSVFAHGAGQENRRNFNVFSAESPRVLLGGFLLWRMQRRILSIIGGGPSYRLVGSRSAMTWARSIVVRILTFKCVFHSNASNTVTFWI